MCLIAGSFVFWQSAIAQAPNLPIKGILNQTLLSGKTFTNGAAVDTTVKNFLGSNAYTLEVVAKVNSATGRGLDIEGRNGALNGFRLSLDAANLKTANPLAAATPLSASRAAENHTIRVAVKGDSAHIYQNGAYLLSQPLNIVKDVVNGAESDQLVNATYGANLIPNWAGMVGNNAGAPSAYGWAYTGTAVTNLFNTANSGSGVRYIDVTAIANQHTYNGSAYVGRIMYIRWDNSTYQSAVYSYPVTLEANTTYDFSWLYSLTANNSGSQPLVVGVGKTVYTADRIASKTFYTNTVLKDLKKDNFTFTSQEAGTYYITINGNFALYSIAELTLRKFSATPRFVFGKNYTAGAVNMEIVSATYEEGAYAPDAVIANPRQTVTITGTAVQIPTTFNTDFVVPGKTDIHFTGENTPYFNSSIALNSNDSWLFFDNVMPSKVISDWLPTVTINGAAAVNNTNVRLAVYKNGTAVIPNGNLTNAAALQVFTQPGLSGMAQTFAIQAINNNLGTFNNSIRSFKLKRGYMATLANNADGSGYSRVFIANDSDLVVNAMPAGLDTTVSFIRVMKWNWPSKKGKAGWDPGKLNATWYYDWNIAGNSTAANYEYQGIRQNAGWPAYGDIINKGVNHISGFNEPDQTNQANLTVDQAFDSWKGIYSTGLRVGSPSPASPESSWITQFLAKCDSFNYRVDYVTIHCYWGGQTPAQWYSRLLAIYNRVKRPLWITEWNNGANWTTESWPTDVPSQQAKQLNDMKGILQVLDTASFIERYAEYDWVENKRALVLADTLTPAGKYYYADKSDFAYNPAKPFVHTWKLAAPRLYSSIADTDYFKVKLSWTDLNGETGSKYILERKIDTRDTGFTAVQTFTGYAVGATMNFVDSVYSKATYRLRAFGIDTASVYSGSLDVIRDAAPVAPASLTGTIISSSRAQLTWNTTATARSYNLKRSASATGPWTTIQTRTTALTYLDTTLAPATTYYYVATTLNSAGESANSTILTLTTPALVRPTNVLNLRVASGDGMAAITWGFQYDAKYKVLRSATENGVYDTIAAELNTLRFVDSNRTNTATYYYKVMAYNEVGASPVSLAMLAKPNWGQYAFLNFDDTTATWSEDMWGGYHAAFASTATRDAGKVGTSLKLDGTANAYATMAPGLLTGLNNFTISAWVKMDALSNWMRIFDFGTGTNQYMFLTPQVSVANGLSTVRYAIKNGGAEQLVSAAVALPLNTWTHFAITQLDSTVKLYVNGMLVATSTGFSIKPSNLGITTQNYIGKSQFADPMLKGSVDEFTIYNYTLSDANINSLFNGNLVVLPITLTNFTGRSTLQGNLLTWKVTTTAASIGMELQKSINGSGFSTVYNTTTNRINTQSPFSYTDVQVKGAINYYRLKMTDVDSKVTYSPVVAISSGVAKGMELVGMYPTLVKSSAYLSINAEKATSIKLVITDMYGRAVQSVSRSIVAGSNLLNVDASALASGTYTISVYNDNLQVGNIRFAVSH